MIDTVMIEIREVSAKSNQQIYKYVNNFEDHDKRSFNEDKQVFKGQMKRLHRQFKGKDKTHYDVGKQFLNSYNYGISFMYSASSEMLRITFSIPKLLYGTNVLLFMNSYNEFGMSEPDQHFNLDYYFKVMRIIEEVVSSFCYNDIESVRQETIRLTRIDYCYNAVFPTVFERNTYFRALNRLKKKGSRGEESFFTYKDQTLMYKTKNYSCKFYKKDDEFKKHDLLNFSLVADKRRVVDIYALAKKTLRFECTYRAGYLSGYYRRIEDEIFKNKGVFNSLNESEIEIRRGSLQKSLNFLLVDSPIRYPDYFHEYLVFIDREKNRFFSPELFRDLFIKTWDFLEQFRIQQIPSDTEFHLKLKRYIKAQEAMKKKVYRNRILTVYELLKNNTLDELVKAGTIHRNTKYSIIKLFQEIGYDVNNTVKEYVDFPYSLDNYISYCKRTFDLSYLNNLLVK